MDRFEAMRILLAAVDAGSLSTGSRQLEMSLPTVASCRPGLRDSALEGEVLETTHLSPPVHPNTPNRTNRASCNELIGGNTGVCLLICSYANDQFLMQNAVTSRSKVIR